MVEGTKAPRGKALIVEDEFLVSLHVRGLLEDVGYEVVGPAARLAEGLHLAEQADLVLAVLDVNIAGVLSWPVARRLRDRGVPFFFITGYLEAHTQMPNDLKGAIVLSKPVGIDGILGAIDRLVLSP